MESDQVRKDAMDDKRRSRFPMKIDFVWGFCMGAQGA
jgi:hypothetical protein